MYSETVWIRVVLTRTVVSGWHFQNQNRSHHDSEDEFHSGCWSIGYQQQVFSKLPSPRQSNYRNCWYHWVQTYWLEQYFVTLLIQKFWYHKLKKTVHHNLPVLILCWYASNPPFALDAVQMMRTPFLKYLGSPLWKRNLLSTTVLSKHSITEKHTGDLFCTRKEHH